MYNKQSTPNTSHAQKQPRNPSFFPQNNNNSNFDYAKEALKQKRDDENAEYRSRAILELTNTSGCKPSEKEITKQVRLLKNRDYAQTSRDTKKNKLLALELDNDKLNRMVESLLEENKNLMQQNELLLGENTKLEQENQQLKYQQMSHLMLGNDYRVDDMGFTGEVNNHYYNSNFFIMSPAKDGQSDSFDKMNSNAFFG